MRRREQGAVSGPLIAELVAHEVGHTLGLRHNFKSSSMYTLAEINSPKVKGKPFKISELTQKIEELYED